MVQDDLFMPDVLYGEDVGDTNASFAANASASDEALIACINLYGTVDLDQMSVMSGIPVDTLIRDLQGSAIFQDPEAFSNGEKWSREKGWVLRARYLTGNIPRKLDVARVMNEIYPERFTLNIQVLESLMPDEIASEEIHVSLGARWIPADLYSAFIRHLLGMHSFPTVYYNTELCAWKIEFAAGVNVPIIANRYTYGCADLSAVEILEQTMNARTVRVYDYKYHLDGSSERIVNKLKTIEAQEKQSAIIRAFEEWIFADERRRLMVQQCYNDTFVGYCSSAYDGSFLMLPDLNPGVRLFTHQRNAIARVLLSGTNLLLAHDVGTGKTYEMVVSAHELYRMGLSRKNLIVVPNNVLRATVEAHELLYPQDRILAVYPKDFAPAFRNSVLEKIRDEDYVCIYMAYSSFDRIVMSKQYWIDQQQERIRKLRRAVSNSAYKREKHALQAEIKQLQRKLEKFIHETEDTPYLPFEQLGVQTLFVDEAHNYKNIPLQSRTDNIVGMHKNGSSKCKEMLEKCRTVQRVIFATGTPLTNSLADLFVIQYYLQYDELHFRGIDNFDAWINTFGERETDFEVDVDADSLRVMTRFASFHNLTELMCLFSTVCDFHHNPEQEESLPKFQGYTDVSVPRNPVQARYLRYLAVRTEDIRAGRVKSREDNLLKVTTDGRKCALDIRLVDLEDTQIEYSEDEIDGGKTQACADRVAELYYAYPDTCQIVFCDLGTPKSGYNIYDALRQALIERGVRECEIAFVHDAVSETARKNLFAAMNRGQIRVTIGSTMKLGIGVNVQERLIALHHLSVPWRPADMVQREGRILRRGNLCGEVFIYRYITQGSFDSYSWQLLQNKQRFIASFLSGSSGCRDSEDISGTVLSYAEVKALAIGDPLIRKRVETANALERAHIKNRQRQKQILDLRAIVERAPEKIASLETMAVQIEADAELYRASKQPVGRQERQAFGEELMEAIADNVMQPADRVFDIYQGFRVILPAQMTEEKPFVLLSSGHETRYRVEMDGDKVNGFTMRLDNVLDDLADRAQRVRKSIEETQRQQAAAIANLEKGNPFEEVMAKLADELREIDRQLEEKEENDA